GRVHARHDTRRSGARRGRQRRDYDRSRGVRGRHRACSRDHERSDRWVRIEQETAISAGEGVAYFRVWPITMLRARATLPTRIRGGTPATPSPALPWIPRAVPVSPAMGRVV